MLLYCIMVRLTAKNVRASTWLFYVCEGDMALQKVISILLIMSSALLLYNLSDATSPKCACWLPCFFFLGDIFCDHVDWRYLSRIISRVLNFIAIILVSIKSLAEDR